MRRWASRRAAWPGSPSRPARGKGTASFAPCTPRLRAGALSSVRPSWRRRRAPLGGLTIVTIPRVWNGALPEADFAFGPWGEDGPNREGKVLRFRHLYVSARARRALIDAGLFSAKAFLPVRVLDDPEPGVDLLDLPVRPLHPMYSPAELEALRAQERERFSARPSL